MNFRQKLICTTYGALIAFIVCLAMNLFLISLGCDGQQQQPNPKPVQTKEDDLAKKLDEIGKERLEGYMTASESERWLSNNHYQVQKKADGNGYIITRNYYDPSTGSSDTRRYGLGDRALIAVGNFSMTTDDKGDLRVKVSGTQ